MYWSKVELATHFLKKIPHTPVKRSVSALDSEITPGELGQRICFSIISSPAAGH